jgi:flagellar protein FliO/FliZ
MQLSPAFKSAGTAVLGLLLLAPASFAADGESTPLNLSEDTKSNAAQSAGSTGGGLVRTIVGLAIVIGVIYGLYWVLKQVKSAREEKAHGSGLHTLATLPLGHNRSLQLVRAGDEVVLVGVGEAGVTPIRTYGEHEARALGLLADDAVVVPDTIELPAETVGQLPAETGRPSFLEALRRKTVIK